MSEGEECDTSGNGSVGGGSWIRIVTVQLYCAGKRRVRTGTPEKGIIITDVVLIPVQMR